MRLLPLGAAARLLGISQAAAFERIRAGLLQGVQDDDGDWHVATDDLPIGRDEGHVGRGGDLVLEIATGEWRHHQKERSQKIRKKCPAPLASPI